VYYFPNAEHYFSINDIEAQWAQIFTPFADRLHNEDELDELLATHQSFWYITSNAGLSEPSWVFLQDKKGWEESAQPRTYSKPFAFRAFTVEKYTYTGADTNKNRGVLHVHITGIRPVGYMDIIGGLNSPGRWTELMKP
jgi:hypothetical protein